MRIGSTITMCIVAVCGVIAAGAFEYFSAADAAGGALGSRLLFADGALPRDRVERITLARAGETAVVLERDGAGWRQATPFDYPLDPARVLKLIQLASELEAIDTIEVEAGASAAEVNAEANPAADASVVDHASSRARTAAEGPTRSVLGLDPPQARLVFEWPGGSTELRLGRRGIAGRAYVSLGATGGVYVVNQALHEAAIDTDVQEWRDRRIFQGVGVESDAIEIVSGESTIRLVRDRKQWKMEAPVRSRLDELALDVLFQALGRATSSGFILDQPGDLGRFGLRETAGTVTVTSTRIARDGEGVARETVAQRLRVGARIGVGTQDRFGLVEGRDVVVRISEPVLQALFRPANALISGTASGVVPADVKSIRVRVTTNSTADDGGENDFLIQRTLEGWIAPDHASRPVPAARVDGLLQTLTAVRATEVSVQPYTRELEVAIITLFGFDGKPLDTVRVAREGPDGRWALENGDNVFRIFPARLILPLTAVEFGLID